MGYLPGHFIRRDLEERKSCLADSLDSPIGQGLSHGLLRQELESAAESHPGYVPYKSVILFTFRADDDGPDGIAARVLVMRDLGTVDELVADRYTLQNRGLNGSVVGENATVAGKNYTTAELKARIKAGLGYEHLVHANLSHVSSDTWMRLLLPTLSWNSFI